MTQQQAKPGWYPLHNDPGTERYWDGNQWSEHHRIRSVPKASGGGSSTGKIILGIVIGFLLVIGGCVVATAQILRGTVETFEALNEIVEVAEGERGSVSNPLRFGESHTSTSVLTGSSWTVSVDQVRSAGDGCLVIIGSATLDSLDDGRLTSEPSSFPDISLFEESGARVRPADCNRAALEAEGLLLAKEVDVEVGASFTWFETFEDDPFAWVGVKGVVYSN